MDQINLVVMGNFLYPMGMAETKRIQHAIDELKKHGIRAISVLLLRQAHVGRDNKNLHGVQDGTPYVTVGDRLQPDWRFPLELLRYILSGAAFLVRQRRREHKNILYLYMEPNIENVLFVIFAKLIGYKIIADVTEDYYILGMTPHFLSRMKSRTASFFARHIGSLVDGMIVISGYLKRKYEKISGGRFPVILLPPVVDMDRFTTIGRTSQAPLRILYSGSFGEKDAVENLVAAFEIVASRHADVILLLTGAGLPERIRPLQEHIAASPYGDRITYLGYLNDGEFYHTLNGSDILCMVRCGSCYAQAGFPFKLGEYLATGHPVIASRVGDVPLYLEDRKNAILVEPGSVQSIVDALEYCFNHPMRAKQIGMRGRKVAMQHFNRHELGDRLFEFLKRV
jgi:glycosyltransferase involved in cell wall biosynthesis